MNRTRALTLVCLTALGCTASTRAVSWQGRDAQQIEGDLVHRADLNAGLAEVVGAAAGASRDAALEWGANSVQHRLALARLGWALTVSGSFCGGALTLSRATAGLDERAVAQEVLGTLAFRLGVSLERAARSTECGDAFGKDAWHAALAPDGQSLAARAQASLTRALMIRRALLGEAHPLVEQTAVYLALAAGDGRSQKRPLLAPELETTHPLALCRTGLVAFDFAQPFTLAERPTEEPPHFHWVVWRRFHPPDDETPHIALVRSDSLTTCAAATAKLRQRLVDDTDLAGRLVGLPIWWGAQLEPAGSSSVADVYGGHATDVTHDVTVCAWERLAAGSVRVSCDRRSAHWRGETAVKPLHIERLTCTASAIEERAGTLHLRTQEQGQCPDEIPLEPRFLSEEPQR